MVFTFGMMVMTITLVMTLRSLSGCRFTNLSKRFLNSRNIGLVSIISDGCSLSLKVKNDILDTTLEFPIIRDVLQNLVAAVLAVQVNIQYNGLLVRLSLSS